MYLAYFWMALVTIALRIFVWVTCWFWAFWASLFKLEALPWGLSILHTRDDNIYGSRTWRRPMPDSFLSRWWEATKWMGRNPAYGFAQDIVGLDVTKGYTLGAASSDDKTAGIFTPIYRVGMGDAFFYKRDWYWTKGFYIKLEFGWRTAPRTPGRLQLEVSIGPKWV